MLTLDNVSDLKKRMEEPWGSTLGSDRASMMDASNNGWKSHLERNNQTTSSESWCRSGNARYKRRQLGGRDGY